MLAQIEFDFTISIGNILSAVSVIVAVFMAAMNISSKISQLQWRVQMIWKWYAKEHGIDEGDEK